MVESPTRNTALTLSHERTAATSSGYLMLFAAVVALPPSSEIKAVIEVFSVPAAIGTTFTTRPSPSIMGGCLL